MGVSVGAEMYSKMLKSLSLFPLKHCIGFSASFNTVLAVVHISAQRLKDDWSPHKDLE